MKNMKTLKLALVLSTFSLALPYAYSGGGSSGGGGSFVCRSIDLTTQKEIIFSAESQDLWEVSRKHPLRDLQGTEESISREALKKLGLNGSIRFQKEVEAALEKVLKIRSVEDVKLISLGDSKHWIEMATCAQGSADFAPAAIYKEEELVYSKSIWEKMDSLSQGALNVHEAVYKVLREEYRDTDSVRARKIVGFLFSEMKIEELDISMPWDEFNPLSTRLNQEKFQELRDLYNHTKKPRLYDLKKLGDVCYYINSTVRQYPTEMVGLTLINNLHSTMKKKGKVRLEGTFGVPDHAFIGLDSSNNLSFLRGVPQFETNPVLDMALAYPTDYNSMKYFTSTFKKTNRGDLIIAHSNFYKTCLKFSKPNDRGTCLEFKQYTDLTDHPDKKLIGFYFCPAK